MEENITNSTDSCIGADAAVVVVDPLDLSTDQLLGKCLGVSTIHVVKVIVVTVMTTTGRSRGSAIAGRNGEGGGHGTRGREGGSPALLSISKNTMILVIFIPMSIVALWRDGSSLLFLVTYDRDDSVVLRVVFGLELSQLVNRILHLGLHGFLGDSGLLDRDNLTLAFCFANLRW